MNHFRSVCMMTASLGSEAFPQNPMSDLSIKRFLEWCTTHGGESFRIPTIDEVLDVWGMAIKVGENKELHTLYVIKQKEGRVPRIKLKNAISEVLKEFPESDHPQVAGMIAAIFAE